MRSGLGRGDRGGCGCGGLGGRLERGVFLSSLLFLLLGLPLLGRWFGFILNLCRSNRVFWYSIFVWYISLILALVRLLALRVLPATELLECFAMRLLVFWPAFDHRLPQIRQSG